MVVNLGGPETYNSSSLHRFSWVRNPLEEDDLGFLTVEFESGGRYAYVNVPYELADSLRSRANNPDYHDTSVGEFFYKKIRNEYGKYGEEYARITSSPS